jgi:hypothetical protein
MLAYMGQTTVVEAPMEPIPIEVPIPVFAPTPTATAAPQPIPIEAPIAVEEPGPEPGEVIRTEEIAPGVTRVYEEPLAPIPIQIPIPIFEPMPTRKRELFWPVAAGALLFTGLQAVIG